MLPRVLLVEDDDVIREIYAMKFELEGFPVAVAENGQVALGMAKSFQPHIILLDMMMPVMGGLEFLENLDRGGEGSPDIIIFSNISAATQMQEVMKLGVSDYWIKSDYTPERVADELAKRWKKKQSDA
jgi:CheY-like chemotaxis protein